jgi:hypothetical protein
MAFPIQIPKNQKQEKSEKWPFMIRKLLVFLPESKMIFKILPAGIEKSKNKRGDSERTHPVHYIL